MNLTNYFNFAYLKQNLKKSKVTLAFMLLILPILTFIMLLIVGKNQEIVILDLKDVSGLTAFGMYIIPVVISILLFSFVFKKKSVDFMGSMPIDRKTIFFTNTIGGIFILVILLFITMLLMIFASAILPNLYIPFGVCLDYILLFLTSYIFVFTACNITVSLSGNVVTSIIVLLLILFFVPFHHYVFKSIYWNTNFDYRIYETVQHNVEECEKNQLECSKEDYSAIYFQPIREDLNYTMPFGIFANSTDLLPDTIHYRGEVVGKMVILSFLYIIIGCLLFEKKEMEVCETSFKKYAQHQFVKILTLIPIFVIVSLALYEVEPIVWIFVVAIVLIYNFIFDLLTKHSIEHLFINFICFLFTFIIVSFVMISSLNKEREVYHSESDTIQLNDIKNVQIDVKYLNLFETDKRITVDDRAIIEELLSIQDSAHNISFIATINGVKYRATNYLTEELKLKIVEYAKKTGQYQDKNFHNILKSREVITIGNDIQVLDQEGIRLLEKAFQNKSEEKYGIPLPISIYKYQDHSLKVYTIYSNIDEELQKYIINSINKKTRESHQNQIHALEVEKIEKTGFTYSTQYVVSGTKMQQIIERLQKKHIIDLNQPIYRITFHCKNKTFYYYSNLDEELHSMLEKEAVETKTLSSPARGEVYAN